MLIKDCGVESFKNLRAAEQRADAAHTNAELVLGPAHQRYERGGCRGQCHPGALDSRLHTCSERYRSGCDNVLLGKCDEHLQESLPQALLIFVTNRAGKVKALLVEEEAVKQRTGRVNKAGGSLWTLTTINLD